MTTTLPVLLYHSVHDHPDRAERPYAVSPSRLFAHADAVRASGRTALEISDVGAQLRGERPLPLRPIAITFDDGYADNLDAVQALIQRGLCATVYVTAGEVGARNRLSPAQLSELASLPGVEVGAHAVRHRRLDELDERELREEVMGSKLRLEDLTGMEISSFSYPHGAYDRRVREAVVAAGYGSAVAVKNALSHDRDDPFAIARWTVTAATSASRITAVMEGRGVPPAWSRERLRTRAFRTARRFRRRLASTRETAR
jgi:peptidoglycan/xylan/chitin deacetylase (PgdA/CDA1 family)